jgi:AraC-like DNA-binding protein
MRYQERAPSADLAPYVQCLWELESHGSALAEPIFPDGRIEVVVHLADRPRRRGDADFQPRAMIVGQMLAATRLDPVARMHAFGVRFTTSGARAWLALPLHGLTGRIEDAGAVCGAAASQLCSAIEQSSTTGERFAAAESAIRRTLRRPPAVQDAIGRAIAVIERSAGTLSIDAVARASGLGARQLERRFLEDVGIAPKALARIVRFQRALRGLRAGATPAAVAAACGFADQPHLAREFRRVAGLPARAVDLGHVAFLQDPPAGPSTYS